MTCRTPRSRSVFAARGIALVVATVASACIGEIDGAGEPASPPGDDPSPAPDPRGGGSAPEGPFTPEPNGTANGTPDTAGPLPLRRLTRTEYANTIRDLLGESVVPVTDYPSEGVGESGFDTAGNVTDALVFRMRAAAEQAAALAAKRLDTLMACAPGANADACARKFLDGFALRAFRRPLLAGEADELHALYASARETHGLDAKGAVTLVLQAIFNSPRFLYRWHPDSGRADRGEVRLGSWEVASRLSYFLWKSMPDERLFARAMRGELERTDAVVEEARRMLADPRAKDAIASFGEDWLDLGALAAREKDRTLYPAYTPELRAAMLAETRAFLHATMLGDGKLDDLFVGGRGFVNEPLGRLYGTSNVSGTELREVKMDPNRRPGLLTQGSYLAIGADLELTSPVRRGQPIRERMLCDEVSAPPVDIPPAPRDPKRSARSQFAEHTKDPGCAGCHALIDPLGWGLEAYDAIGAYRSTDAGEPVDATGHFTSLKDGSKKSFNGALELSRVLASSDEVRQCMVRQMFRFAIGRHELDAEAGSLNFSYERFKGGGFLFRDLLVAIAQSRAFLHRSLLPGEVLP